MRYEALLIDSQVKNLKDFFRISHTSSQFKKLMLVCLVGPMLHVFYTHEYSVVNDLVRYVYITFWLLITFILGHSLYMTYVFLRKRNQLIQLEFLADQLRNTARPVIARTSNRTLLVKAGLFQNYMFFYRNIEELDRIEKFLKTKSRRS